MIRVNLLPPRFVKEARARQMKLVFGFLGAAVVLALGWNVYRQISTIADLEKQIKAKKDEAAPYEAKIAEIQRLKGFEEELNKRRAVVGELVKAQGLYPRLLEKVARLMPRNAWLEQLIVDEPKDAAAPAKVIIRGATLGRSQIFALQEALRIQKEFASVFLKSYNGVVNLTGTTYKGYTYEINLDYVPSKVYGATAVGG